MLSGKLGRVNVCLTPILSAVLSLFLTGCGSDVEKAVEQTTEEAYPIDPAGILSIRNTLGSIRIYGSDGSEIKVKATKKASSASQLNGISVKVSGKPVAISLETIFPPQKTWIFSSRSGTVDFVVGVPRQVRIGRLEIGNGDVVDREHARRYTCQSCQRHPDDAQLFRKY